MNPTNATPQRHSEPSCRELVYNYVISKECTNTLTNNAHWFSTSENNNNSTCNWVLKCNFPYSWAPKSDLYL